MAKAKKAAVKSITKTDGKTTSGVISNYENYKAPKAKQSFAKVKSKKK